MAALRWVLEKGVYAILASPGRACAPQVEATGPGQGPVSSRKRGKSLRMVALIAAFLPVVNRGRGGFGNILPGLAGPLDYENRDAGIKGQGHGAEGDGGQRVALEG